MPYSIRATFSDGQSESASLGKPTPPELRERNLAWYGQTDIRTNTLFQSFSRYNFLDTDAAVAIADSKKDFEEDLSKLLVGPEASKTWREIERTSGELEKTLKDLSAVDQQVRRELREVEKQIAMAAAVPKESDALLKTLSDKVSETGWPITTDELAERIPNFISAFATLESIVEQALPCDWSGSPVTLQSLRNFEATVEQVLLDAEAAILKCKSSSRRLLECNEADERLAKMEQAVGEFAGYLDSEFSQKRTRYLNAQIRLRETQRRLTEKVFDPTELASVAGSPTPLDQLRSQNAKALEASQAEVRSSRSRLAEFIKLRDQAALLSQQLRDIASQILTQTEEKDVCPLCHWEYGSGELTSRIYQDIDSRIESESSTLRESLRKSESQVANAEKSLAISEWLQKVAAQNDVPAEVEAQSIVSKVIELYQQEETETRELHEAIR